MKSRMDELDTELNLDETTWDGKYKDFEQNGKFTEHTGWVKFKQNGSRIVGDGFSESREWILEGIVYKGRICYIYVGKDSNETSMGVVTLEVDASGKKLVGQWSGWAPDGSGQLPQDITYEKRLS